MSSKRSLIKVSVVFVFATIALVSAKLDLAVMRALAAGAYGQNQSQSNKTGASDPVELRLPKELQPGSADDFIGTDTCKACHADKYEEFARTAHYVTFTSAKYVAPMKGCEMCHGPGRKHLEAGGGAGTIFNPQGAKAQEVAAMCVVCHSDQSGRQNFHQNQHDIAAVSCNDCHSPHQPKKNPFMLISRSPQLCIQCHREIRREFAKPFHHKVLEGGMNCNDCHQQHGLLNKTQTVDMAGGMDALCLRCHTDKQGPFVFEHMPARRDGCTTCHTPHGSINNRMLVRSQVKMLCMQCHGDRQGSLADQPQGSHDLRLPRYQNCTGCHVAIHGSNHDRVLLQ